MLMGRVVGEVWATVKDEKVTDMKFLVVRRIGLDGQLESGHVVAADAVGAGSGDIVLVVQGSSARQCGLTNNRPIDATIMAVVDGFDVDERDWDAFDARRVTPEAR